MLADVARQPASRKALWRWDGTVGRLQDGFGADAEGDDRQHGPEHGTVGPAKRAFPCVGAPCWTPNRFGACKVCGGTAPAPKSKAR